MKCVKLTYICIIRRRHKYICSSASLHDLQDTINRELDKLLVWFSVNRLSLNLGKTNYMLFRSTPPDNELALEINNVVLPRVAANLAHVYRFIREWK